MICSRLIATDPAPFLKSAAFLCMIALTAILPAYGAPVANPTPVEKTVTTASPEPSAPLITKSSRYISPEELPAYIQAVSLTFSMKSRATDPFGQQQNPDAKPVIKATIDKPTRVKTLPSQITPFAEIVRRIHVTTVMPAERRFLIDDRAFKQGDRFPMDFNNRRIKVEIVAVSSREITFRNLDNGESASLKLTLMPPGMTPGNGKITAPGMVSDNANSPLVIDPANSPIDNPQN